MKLSTPKQGHCEETAGDSAQGRTRLWRRSHPVFPPKADLRQRTDPSVCWRTPLVEKQIVRQQPARFVRTDYAEFWQTSPLRGSQ